jgi:hypothetical protein
MHVIGVDGRTVPRTDEQWSHVRAGTLRILTGATRRLLTTNPLLRSPDPDT